MSQPLPKLPPRKPDSNKGDFGKVLLIGGSRDMPGSISLSGMACLRSGAGLVTIATSSAAQPIVAGFEPSYMVAALPIDDSGRFSLASLYELRKLIQRATVVAIGPGLGRSANLTQLVVKLYRETALPMIFDADGLNALAAQQTANPHENILAVHAGPRIITPHPGEFARLAPQLVHKHNVLDDPTEENRVAAATELAAQADIVVVLKGHQTVIADRARHALNHTGNPSMATGGTGDVLTGILAALVGQHMEPFDAARLGVHIHGRAGDLAAAELGQVSLIASDLLRFLPQPFKAME